MADSVTASLIHCGEGYVWGHLMHFDPTGVNGGASRNLVATVAGGCAAIVFIIVLTVSFLLVAQRRRMQTDERPGGEGV